MKGSLKSLLKSLAVLILMSSPLYCEVATSTDITRNAQAIGFTQSLDVGVYDRFSIHAVYSDGTPSAHTLEAGSRSTNNITVDNFNQLYEKEAAVSIRVATTSLTGHTLTLNGIVFTAGSSFSIGATTAITTQNLSNAINAYEQFIATHGQVAATNANLIYSSASVKGTGPNSWTAVTSTPAGIVLGGATFSGGQTNASIYINGVTYTQGTDWTAATSNALTAESIETAFNADTDFTAIFTATHPNTTSVVYTTVTQNGAVEYSISVSTPGLTLAFPKIEGGKASSFHIAGDSITESSHGLTVGMAVLYATGTSAAIGGLQGGTTYFAIRVDDNRYKLATSSTNAASGTAVDITSLPNVGGYTITPIALSVGSAGFHWQGSNENQNWSDLSITSITYSASGNTLFDFGEYNYRYIRINFVAPTRGGIALRGILTGRKD